MYLLNKIIKFPSYDSATEDGLIAIGGDLSEKRVVLAYKKGIFPWYSEGEPILWFCPKERMVLFPDEIKISKSMQKIIKKKEFKITENTAFEQVIYHCKHIDRKDEFGTWITDDMEQAYINLYKKGVAKSIEVWLDDVLVGGLYGVVVGTIFCGESMFSKVSNASKVAFIYLAQQKEYSLIDCQMYNEHLASLGAREIKRVDFLKFLG